MSDALALLNEAFEDRSTRHGGTTDHAEVGVEHALALARDAVKHLARRHEPWLPQQEVREPVHAAEEIYGIIPRDTRYPYDVREIIARIVDASEFHEFKPLYGKTIVCGFAHSKALTSSSLRIVAASRSFSCRTSPASWSARRSSTAASRRTARRW